MNRQSIGHHSLLVLALLLAAAGGATAQTPVREEVPRYAEQSMSHDWYTTQQKLWREAVDIDHSNSTAWLNLFKATRYAGFGDRSPIDERVERMNGLLDEMAAAIPESWEYPYARWWNGGNNLELLPELQRAYELNPGAAEILECMATAYEILGNREQVKNFCTKWYASRAMSSGLLSYCSNVLASLDRNAVIFTVGDNDTYPLWILQQALGIRTDVTVINTSLAFIPEYCRWLMKEQKVEGDPSILAPERLATVPYDSCVAEFIASVARNTTDRPVYAALTVDPDYLRLIRDDLYIVGLASRYSPKRIDNIAILKRNWDQFRLDYIDQDFYSDRFVLNRERLPQIHMNYVAPAVLLYEHYLVAGQKEKSERFRNFALRIGRQGGEEEGVMEYLKGVATPASHHGVDDAAASGAPETNTPKRLK